MLKLESRRGHRRAPTAGCGARAQPWRPSVRT